MPLPIIMNGFFLTPNKDIIAKSSIDFIDKEFSNLAFEPIEHEFYDHRDDLSVPNDVKSIIWNSSCVFVARSRIPNEENPIEIFLTFEKGNIGSTILTKIILNYQIPKIKSDFYLHHDNTWSFISENEKLERKLNDNVTLMEIINSYVIPSKEIYGVKIENKPPLFTSDINEKKYLFLSNIPYIMDDQLNAITDPSIDIINAIYSELLHL